MDSQVIMAGPLSKESKYSLAVSGTFGSREIKNLITFLQLQLEWAKEDEAAKAESDENVSGDKS